MKTWKKEILVAAGLGAVVIALLFVVFEFTGATFGPCGPSNGAGVVMMFAALPAMLLISWIPSGDAWAWLASVLFWPALLISYSFPIWVIIRIQRKKPSRMYFEEEPIQLPETTRGK